MKIVFVFAAILLALVSSLACQKTYTLGPVTAPPPAAPTNSNTPTPFQSATPTQTYTVTNTPTGTATPTGTLPTSTCTFTPTVTSTPTICANLTPVGNNAIPEEYANVNYSAIVENFVAPGTGSVNSAYIYSGINGGNVILGIYSNNAGGTDAASLLANSNSTPLSTGWNYVPLSPTVTLTGGVTYWRAIQTDAAATVGFVQNYENFDSTANTYGSLPATWPSSASISISAGNYTFYYNLCP